MAIMDLLIQYGPMILIAIVGFILHRRSLKSTTPSIFSSTPSSLSSLSSFPTLPILNSLHSLPWMSLLLTQHPRVRSILRDVGQEVLDRLLPAETSAESTKPILKP